MVAKRHKITNVPLFKKLWDIIFFFWDNHFMSHFLGHSEGAFVPKKKIMSRSFLNSGTLIVKRDGDFKKIRPNTDIAYTALQDKAEHFSSELSSTIQFRTEQHSTVPDCAAQYRT
jgi:hypothetical protein